MRERRDRGRRGPRHRHRADRSHRDRGPRVGAYCVGTWNRERHLLKHGITVAASPANTPGTYLYTDSAGMARVLSDRDVEPCLRASNNLQDPSDVLVPHAPFMRRFNITWRRPSSSAG
ncbi:hypothetical protein GCM10023237_68930 [Streptomyces coeruleoprunus]